MAELVEARLAKRLVERDGRRTLVYVIQDREEFVVQVPSTFPAVLGCIVTGRPGDGVQMSVDVLSHMSRPIWGANQPVECGAEGRVEVYCPIEIPVLDVGPCYVILKLDNTEVWRQRVFFALR